MLLSGWVQLALYVALLLAITKPMGVYLMRVLDPDRAGREPVLARYLGPVERGIYWICRVNPKGEQTWKQYLVAVMVFSVVSMVLTYGILRFQDHLPLNPRNMPAVPEHLAFNTAASFTTNTNWQSYGGESTMSYLSQMLALAVHNFFSAAVGIAIAAVVVRGLARDKSRTIGNFWRDLVRLHLYLLLPICILFAFFLVGQGIIQNFKPYTTVNAVDQTLAASATQPAQQVIAQGPVASQIAIKMLGTNGGGFFNANAAHPFENNTPLSNFIQMLSIFAIPTGLTYYLGRMMRNQRHGWAVWGAMFVLFLAGTLTCWWAESAGNMRLPETGVAMAQGNMEGKEVRFGIFNSALFTTITTDASCGAVNNMHDSLTPIGGVVPMFNMHLGEVVFGGVGAGLYGMLQFVIIAIFIAGLMVGRTPEYLGKKIEAYDVKAATLGVLAPSLAILGFSAWACVTGWGLAGLNNNGPHGYSEILYAFTSGAANNGSAFAGLTTNTPWYNTTLAIDMLVGRFFIIIPVVALAGNMAKKKLTQVTVGTFPVSGPTFVMLLVGTVVVVGALTFLPALALGPVVEHFLMHGTRVMF